MISSLVVALSFVILSSSLVYLGRAKEKTEVVSSLVSLESQIQTALANPENYSSTIREQLSSRQVPNFSIVIRNNDNSTWNMPANGQMFVSKKFQPCTGFDDADCWYQVNMNFAFFGAEPSFGYRITINPSVVERTPVSTMQIATVGQSDYSFKVPSDFYKTTDSNSCADDVAVRGLNKATGQVYCVTKPTTNEACAPGTFPKRLVVVDGVLRLRCSSAAPALACPANYSISSIDTHLLDRGTAQASCLLTAQSSGALPTALVGGSISGEVCPPNYHLTSRCSALSPKVNSNGFCAKTCTRTIYPPAPPCTRVGPSGSPPTTVMNCPPAPPPYNEDYDCSYSFPPNAGSLVERTAANSRNVDCAISVPAQVCPGDCNRGCTPAQWDADASINVNCQLNGGISETEVAR